MIATILSSCSLFWIVVRVVHGQTPIYNMADLQCIPPVPENASIGHLKSVYAIQEEKWGCLHNTHRPGDGKNNWTPILNMSEALQDPQFLNGTTYWINEHMAVGHAIYDISIIQVLQSTKVNVLILRR